jgi:glycosyltransferase involved in cell wall biosynthesis
MTPEVSVVVPTHNRAALLRTTLRTVLWQRDASLEALVVDDGSSDGTAATVEQLGDPRVQVLRHDAPQGVCAARNRGAAEARGRWLAFCDDDDLWAPDKLARQLAAARETGRDWAYGGAVHVSIDLRVLSLKPPPSPEELMRGLPGWSAVPGGSSNVMVRVETFHRAGGWDPSLINLADWDLWARLAREGPPACAEGLLVGYRIHPGNASADTDLILREAGVLDGRYGAPLDYGRLHHYLAWVHLRSGRRRSAVGHLARAAVRGQVGGVIRSLGTLAGRRAARWGPGRRPKEDPAAAASRAESEAWLAPLRQAGPAAS